MTTRFRCPLCSSNLNKGVFHGKQRLEVSRCLACGALYRPLPDSHEWAEYDSDYYANWDVTEEQLDHSRMKTPDLERFLEGISRFKNCGRLLDVGCATGDFLKCAQEAGYECVGIEPHRKACSLARSRYGFEVFSADFLNFVVADESFDIVTMIHVLEHVPDPAGALGKAWRILKHGGVLAIEVPCLTAIWFGLLRSRHPIFKGSHITFFSKQTLLKSLTRAGFRVLEARYCGRTMSLGHLLGWLCSIVLGGRRMSKPSNLSSLTRPRIHLNLGFTLQVYASKS